ncbi:hypothetical protein B0A49_08990 [Cryomyces minteri]|uniref:Squalene epoxidase ERG1 n=2 Tax=Cryomyces TaxID=329878 RepID=A0A4U0WJH9_9PEZI|nr:hypothetical protein B0A49_08990 [Cryomyces minteri]
MPLMLDSPPPEAAPSDPGEERRRLHHEADVVIIGAGILGCALAVALGNQGRSVILLERSLKQPDRIVGELLQPGGVAALEKLGLRDCLEDIDAIKVEGYEVIYYGEEVRIPYPAAADDTEKKRPQGRSFHHGRFIQRLREAAMRTPNVTVIETTATDLVKNGWTGQILGVEGKTKGEKDYFFGALTIIADGYASKFRKEYIKHTPVSKSKFWGLELIDADLPLPHHGHVVLGDGAPILLYQIGTHETRALIDIPENLPSASVKNGGVKGHLRDIVLPSLPKKVQPSFEAAIDSGALRSMPNSFLPPSTNTNPGMVILGDAMNMRHPLTGGGMTVAFNDAVLLSELLSPELVPTFDDTKLVLKQMERFHWQRKSLTSVINILAQALYSLFAANDPQLKALQLGCFRYFHRGGACIDGPVGLLAGIIRRPFVLFYHFFAVALLAIWIYISSAGILNLPAEDVAVHYGFGKHGKDLTKENLKHALMYFWLYQICYKLLGGFTKLAFLCLYFRLFWCARTFMMIAKVTIVVVIVGSLAFACGTVLMCTPVQKSWNRQLQGECFNYAAFWYAHAGFNTLMDIWIYIMPLPVLVKLKMEKRDRYGLYFVFALGAFVIAASVTRMVLLNPSSKTPDPTWGSMDALIWTEVEANTAIICACLPVIRKLFVILWCRLRCKHADEEDRTPIVRNPRLTSLASKSVSYVPLAPIILPSGDQDGDASGMITLEEMFKTDAGTAQRLAKQGDGMQGTTNVTVNSAKNLPNVEEEDKTMSSAGGIKGPANPHGGIQLTTDVTVESAENLPDLEKGLNASDTLTTHVTTEVTTAAKAKRNSFAIMMDLLRGYG